MLVKVDKNSIIKYSIEQLKKDNPGTSFPKEISNEFLAAFNVFPVITVPAPDIDSKTHRHASSIIYNEGKYVQQWIIVELPQKDAEKNIRAHRDYLLKECDWIVLLYCERSQLPPKEWLAYRQALRDISLQSEFPYKVKWPDAPINKEINSGNTSK